MPVAGRNRFSPGRGISKTSLRKLLLPEGFAQRILVEPDQRESPNLNSTAYAGDALADIHEIRRETGSVAGLPVNPPAE
jgi:hypothetical protein